MTGQPDRAGQVWERKPRKAAVDTGQFTIVRWEPHPDAELFDGLWVCSGTDWERRPFEFTVSEAVLKRDYFRRVAA